MIRILIIMGILSSLFCKTVPHRFRPVQEHKRGTIVSSNETRSFMYYLPQSESDKPKSLIFLLHGGGGSGEGMVYLTRFSDRADELNYITVYPDGYKGRWNDGRNISFSVADQKNINDIQFFRDLVLYFQSEYGIDESKIFVGGLSNGGFMAQRLLCEAPDLFTAGYSVAALTSTNLTKICASSNPVSLGFIMGKRDDIIPYKGGKIFIPGDPNNPKKRHFAGENLSFEDSLHFWSKQMNCEGKRQANVPRMGSFWKRNIEYTEYSSCNHSATLEGYLIPDAGHIWPHGFYYTNEKKYGYLSEDLDTTEVLLNFFFRSKPKEKEKSSVYIGN